MIIAQQTTYGTRRKDVAKLKEDGYISMTEISGRQMTFDYQGITYQMPFTPNRLKKTFEQSNRWHCIMVHENMASKKYWYKLSDLAQIFKYFNLLT